MGEYTMLYVYMCVDNASCF